MYFAGTIATEPIWEGNDDLREPRVNLRVVDRVSVVPVHRLDLSISRILDRVFFGVGFLLAQYKLPMVISDLSKCLPAVAGDLIAQLLQEIARTLNPTPAMTIRIGPAQGIVTGVAVQIE